jgi:drug/metabolite transporter (DMT)-like permease
MRKIWRRARRRSNEIAIASTRARLLTHSVFGKKSNGYIIFSLCAAVFLWGGSNTGSKYLVAAWPAAWVGCTRLLTAGLILLALLKWTPWLGSLSPLSAKLRRDLWLRGGLMLAGYILAFVWALRYTPVSHVAVYLGMSPIWALAWDHPPSMTWRSAQRYGAAALAFSGVLVLFWPSLRHGHSRWFGELLGLTASLLWAAYGRQSRAWGSQLSGAEISAHTMWRAGALLVPISLYELATAGLDLHPNLVLVQVYCILAGGVVAYVLWNNALKHWPTSQVFMFNNLIPLSTASWAAVCLGEKITPTFWVAMALVIAGVIVGRTRWEKILGEKWLPAE